jgi:hypothetical protein
MAEKTFLAIGSQNESIGSSRQTESASAPARTIAGVIFNFGGASLGPRVKVRGSPFAIFSACGVHHEPLRAHMHRSAYVLNEERYGSKFLSHLGMAVRATLF